MAAEENSTVAATIDQFLRFLEEDVRGHLGYEYTLRDGSLLGALRHGGLIPGDRDLDAVILLPEGESLADLRAACDARLEARGRPFDLGEVDSPTGVTARWLLLRPWIQPKGYPPVVADLTVYPNSLLHARTPEASLDVRAAFSGLCRCSFSGLSANCFVRAPEYLTRVYGNYTRPSLAHASQREMFDLVDDALL